MLSSMACVTLKKMICLGEVNFALLLEPDNLTITRSYHMRDWSVVSSPKYCIVSELKRSSVPTPRLVYAWKE